MSEKASSFIRVVLCAPNLSRAGAERMSLHLFEGLDRNLFKVKMYVHEQLSEQFEPQKHFSDDVRYGQNREYRRQHLGRHLAQTIRMARHADVIVGVSEGRASALALVAGALLGKPVVLWLHADWQRFTEILSWRVKSSVRAFRYASAIVACSQGVANSHIKAFPSNAKLLRVIPNGIDVKGVELAAKADLPEALKTLFEGPTVVAVGRLNQQKGFDHLIHAHKRARQMGVNFNLVIVGAGDELSALDGLSKELGVSESVHLVGFQENPHRFMSKATIFVSSSRFEGFGLVIAEALACKAPVIAYDCPSGPAEILGQGRYGVLVPPQDIEALAHEIVSLLADPTRRASLSANGPSRAKNFDIDAFRDSWAEVIKAAVRS